MAKIKLSHLLLSGLAICLLLVFYVSVPPLHSVPSKNDLSHKTNGKRGLSSKSMKNPKELHKLAILVPFRDRFEELMDFVPHISNFLNEQQVLYHIFIINQVDGFRFNRASLLNVGFLETQANYDYLALHDVDLLPMNHKLIYSFPSDGPYHMASPYLHPRYHYPTFIGGILLLRRDHFLQVNGMSNKYWGWGLEDDEFYARLQEAKFSIHRPENFTSGTKETFKHLHNRKIRRRDMIQCFNQQTITRKRDRDTGLSTTKYKISSLKELTIEGHPFTVLNAELSCSFDLTPWCNCTRNTANTKPSGDVSKVDLIVPRINRKVHLSPNE